MIPWMLALKRALKPGTVLMLLVVLVTVWLGGSAGSQTSLRPCGVVCEDPGAREAAFAMEQKGFLLYDSREAMAADVSRGKLDCGAVLLPGLGEAIMRGEPSGHVLLLIAPDSFLTEAYEAHIGASLVTAAAPYITLEAAQEAGVTLNEDDVRRELNDFYAGGYRFTFDIVTTEGVPPVVPNLGQNLAQAAAALLLFAAILPGTRRIVEDTRRLMPRIGRAAAVKTILIPALAWQLVLYLLAAGIPAPGLLPALAGYALLLTALGLILAGLRLRAGVLLPIVLLGSLGMFPIYVDLAAVVPELAALRYILPPCWLMQAVQFPLPAAAAGLVLTAACMVLYAKGGSHDRI